MSDLPTKIIVRSLAKEFSNMEYPQIKAFCSMILSENFHGVDLDLQSEYYAKKISTCKSKDLEKILIDLYQEAN